MKWYLAVLKKYSIANGRARRKEYWMFYLFNTIFLGVAIFLDNLLRINFSDTAWGPISGLYALAVFVPNINVGIRRLHDVGRSGWDLLIGLIPIIGPILLLIYFCKDSAPGVNKYGPNPKEDNQLIKDNVAE